MLLDHVCCTNEAVVAKMWILQQKNKKQNRQIINLQALLQPGQIFCGGLWFLVGSASVFWKQLAGIRGALTDGFLRESSVIQQRCVYVWEEKASQEHMVRNRAQNKLSDLYRALETLKTTEAQTSFFSFTLSLRFPLWQGADGYLMLIRISK